MRAVLGLILLLAIATPCVAAPADGAPPPPPFGGASVAGARSLAIGPKDWGGAARKVKGKTALVAVIPPDVTSVANVLFFLDDKSIGSVSQAPFKLDFDASSVSLGDHVFKAVARDAAEKELWSAKTNASVVSPDRKVAQPAPLVPGGGGKVTARRSAPSGGALPPDKPRKADRPRNKKPGPLSTDFKLPEGVTLDRDYSNVDYGFSVRHPGKWTFLDQSTTMNPRNPGDFWLAFGEYPVEKAPIVVNIRRVGLKKGTTAESFAKYNSYVANWESRTVLGCPAFSTTAKAASQKSVTHRMIVIKDGYALMMNCIDTSGRPAEESRGIFENMIASISGAGQAEANPEPVSPPAL